MTTEEEVEAFLAHWGVKGMKWGVRREAKREAKRKLVDAGKRTTGWQKAGFVSGGYAAGTVASLTVLKLTGSVPLSQLASWGAMIPVAVKMRKSMLKKNGNRKVSSLKSTAPSKSELNDIRELEDFIKKNKLAKT